MQDYTYLCIRPDGSIPVMDIQACKDEQEARDRLRALFREHASCETIEVWSGSQRIMKAQREIA